MQKKKKRKYFKLTILLFAAYLPLIASCGTSEIENSQINNQPNPKTNDEEIIVDDIIQNSSDYEIFKNKNTMMFLISSDISKFENIGILEIKKLICPNANWEETIVSSITKKHVVKNFNDANLFKNFFIHGDTILNIYDNTNNTIPKELKKENINYEMFQQSNLITGTISITESADWLTINLTLTLKENKVWKTIGKNYKIEFFYSCSKSQE